MPYIFLKEQQQVNELLPVLMQKPVWGMDTEDTGLDCRKDKVTLLQIGDQHNQYLIDTRRTTVEPLRPFFESADHRKICHNSKFDYKMIKGTFGIDVEGLRCTFLAEKLLNVGRRFSGNGLDDLCQNRLGVMLDKTIRKSFIGFTGDFSEEQLGYAAGDVQHLFAISRQQCDEMMAVDLQRTYLLECDFVSCLGDMEFGGFRLDVDLWRSLIEENKLKAKETKVKMNEIAGQFFPRGLFGEVAINYGSPKQVLDLLRRLRVTIPERMPDGTDREVPIPDTNENTLNKIGKPYPIIKLLTDLREYEKKVSTYGQSFIDAIHPLTGLIHAQYDQLGTETGRLASATESPFNPLNVPKLKTYRNAFLARHPGDVVETDDYSGCELRIWAELSKDPGLIEAYSKGVDIHCYAASKMFGVEVTKKNENAKLRSPAKGLNFGGH